MDSRIGEKFALESSSSWQDRVREVNGFIGGECDLDAVSPRVLTQRADSTCI